MKERAAGMGMCVCAWLGISDYYVCVSVCFTHAHLNDRGSEMSVGVRKVMSCDVKDNTMTVLTTDILEPS